MNGKIPVLVDPESIQSPTADSRGRVNLGTEYAGQTLQVAVLAVDGFDDVAGADPEQRAQCPNNCSPLSVVVDGEQRRVTCPVCGYDGGTV